MNQPPLNPDAIEHAIKEVYGDGPRMDWPSDMTGYQTHRDYARTIVEQIASAYLAVAQPEVNSFDPRALNRKGWTCGCEPGNYDTCDECQSVCNDLANFLNRLEDTK